MRAALAVTVAVLLVAGPAALAQDAGPDGSGITIAVLDTGVDSSHPQLSGRVERQSFAEPEAPGVGGIPDLGLPVEPLAEDPDGQGTAVASLAAGSGLGVAKAARILDLQVSAKYTGQAQVDPATEAAAIDAMDALLRDPSRARVVVLSFAQDGVSAEGGRTLAAQARSLRDDGVLVVVPSSPSANPLSEAAHVLTIAGVEGCPAPMGPTLKPDLVAASNGLTVATPRSGATAGSTGPRSGTALAAAQVAGAAALMFAANGDLPVDAVASFLRDAADDRGAAGPDACTGFGQLNTTSALDWAGMWHDPLSTQGPRDSPGLGLAFGMIGLAVALAARRARA